MILTGEKPNPLKIYSQKCSGKDIFTTFFSLLELLFVWIYKHLRTTIHAFSSHLFWFCEDCPIYRRKMYVFGLMTDLIFPSFHVNNNKKTLHNYSVHFKIDVLSDECRPPGEQKREISWLT